MWVPPRPGSCSAVRLWAAMQPLQPGMESQQTDFGFALFLLDGFLILGPSVCFSLQVLKWEVELMARMAKTIDSFTQNQTRLVVIIDGLDACEQDKVLQMLDTVCLNLGTPAGCCVAGRGCPTSDTAERGNGLAAVWPAEGAQLQILQRGELAFLI